MNDQERIARGLIAVGLCREAVRWVEEKRSRTGHETFSPEWYEAMKKLLAEGAVVKCGRCKRDGHRKKNCPYDANVRVEPRLRGEYKTVSPEMARTLRKIGKSA